MIFVFIKPFLSEGSVSFYSLSWLLTMSWLLHPRYKMPRRPMVPSSAVGFLYFPPFQSEVIPKNVSTPFGDLSILLQNARQ